MKPHFTDLTKEQQATYGNGCGLYANFLNVPDFVFTASCRHHDFNYARGVGADKWWQNLYRWPFYYLKTQWDFFTHMCSDAKKPWHYVVAVIYFVTVTLVSFPWFDGGRWKTIDELLAEDSRSKRSV